MPLEYNIYHNSPNGRRLVKRVSGQSADDAFHQAQVEVAAHHRASGVKPAPYGAPPVFFAEPARPVRTAQSRPNPQFIARPSPQNANRRRA